MSSQHHGASSSSSTANSRRADDQNEDGLTGSKVRIGIIEAYHLGTEARGKQFTYSRHNRDSFLTSSAESHRSRSNIADKGPSDFISFITMVSRMYVEHRHLDMMHLGPRNEGEYLGEGAVFEAHSATTSQYVPSRNQRGKQDQLHHEVVTKARKSHMTSGARQEDTQTILNGFVKDLILELHILRHDPIRAHRNIVTLLGIGWFYDQQLISPLAIPRIVLERADCTLEDYLDENDPPQNTRVSIMYGVASGLSALHMCKIVHGDLKPDNILMFGTTPKLADFSYSIIEADLNGHGSKGTYF